MGYVDVYVDVRQLHVSTGYTRHDTESQHTIAHEVTCQAAVRGATDDVCWACIRVVTLFYDMCVSGIMGGLDVVVLRRSRGRRSIDMYIARVLVSVYLYEWDEGVVLRCVTMERMLGLEAKFTRPLRYAYSGLEAIHDVKRGIILLILGGFAWCYTHAYIEDGVTCIAKSSVTFLAKRSKIPTGAWPMAFSSVEPYVDEMFYMPARCVSIEVIAAFKIELSDAKRVEHSQV
ncbi:hypothetical protein Tco_0505970 [Tanacetum coccineum]